MAQPNLLETKVNFSTAFAKVLDKRLLKALGEMGFARPTLIQSQAIPIALEGRDILARARTGSGKTAAYCIPVVQKILQAKTADPASIACTRALILVPTKELSEQVTAYLRKLLVYCDKTIKATNIASGASGQIQRMLLADVPDVIVATPARVIALLQSKVISLGSLESLVIDEADLILSYGHDADVRNLLSGDYLPKLYQSLLMSATMTEDVETLKGIVLRDPAILKLEENKDEAANLSQYFVRCNETDKFLLIYVILKLKLVQGKCILFVNEVDRCYRLKLFLEQFSIKSCVLNPELPINSRFHIVQEFNKGVYDYIIASDESVTRGEVEEVDEEDDDADSEEEEENDGQASDVDDEDADDMANASVEPAVFTLDEDLEEAESGTKTGKKRKQSPIASTSQPSSKRAKMASKPTKSPAPDDEASDDASEADGEDADATIESPTATPAKSQKPAKSHKANTKGKPKSKGKTDKEFGVSRGVDFVDVACVINFDFPTSSREYTHRVGRTARAGRSGLAISFVVPTADWGKNKILCAPSAKRDEKVFARVEKEQSARGSKIKEYEFDRRQVEAFRYRMEDALRSVTRVAIKEARVKELKAEILNSDKLKAHFEDHPLDLDYLRHDKPLRPTRIQAHLKQVPKYLVPRIAPVPSADGTVLEDTASGNIDTGGKVGFVPFRKQGATRGGRGNGRGGRGGARGGRGGGGGGRKKDPLRKFK